MVETAGSRVGHRNKQPRQSLHLSVQVAHGLLSPGFGTAPGQVVDPIGQLAGPLSGQAQVKMIAGNLLQLL